MRFIDRVRDAYGAVVARLVRVSIIGLALVAVAMFGVYGPGPRHADRLPAGRRPGRVLCRRAACRTALPSGAPPPSSAGRSHPQAGARDRRLQLDHRAELHRQLLPAERRVRDRLAQAVRGALGPFAGRSRDHRAARPEDAARGARRHRRADRAAADHRSRNRRRVQLRAAGFRAAATRGRWPRRCGACSSPPTRIRN